MKTFVRNDNYFFVVADDPILDDNNGEKRVRCFSRGLFLFLVAFAIEIIEGSLNQQLLRFLFVTSKIISFLVAMVTTSIICSRRACNHF